MPVAARDKQVRLKFVLPPDLEHGVYATITQVQPSTWDYTLTFYHAIMPPGTDAIPAEVEAKAVARVVLPRSVAEQLARLLAESVGRAASEAHAGAEE